MDLTASEIRVLGCLIEKQRTTPDAYPLTLNALRTACNQSTARDPVVRYDDATVRDAMTRLSRRRWARLAGGGRAPKFRHLLDDALTRAPDELAVLCVLMLRGPQTPGELKQRTDRLHAFADLGAVHETLRRLIERELVMQLERRPGQKEERYAHRLGEDAEDAAPLAAARYTPPPPAGVPQRGADAGAAPGVARHRCRRRAILRARGGRRARASRRAPGGRGRLQPRARAPMTASSHAASRGSRPRPPRRWPTARCNAASSASRPRSASCARSCGRCWTSSADARSARPGAPAAGQKSGVALRCPAMYRVMLLAGAVLALLCAAPANAAIAAKRLPAVAKSLTASKAGACTTTTYRAPLAGFLDARLRGSGDWDLELRDTAGRVVAASRGFGGREVAQVWVRGGQRITARACRGDGAGPSARTTFRLAQVALPKLPSGPVQLLRVYGTDKQLHALERNGLDVTHAMGRGWADVLVSGVKELASVVTSGLRYTVRVADFQKAYASARAADRRYAARAGGSPLPSGRTSYRTLPEVQGELKGLVDANPGLVRKVVFGTSYQGREISGVEIAKDVGAADGRPVFFLVALHHAREWPSLEAAMEFAHLLVQGQGDARIADLLARVRVVILPAVNPDGYVVSRGAFDPGDALGQNPDVTLVEAIAPPGGLLAYRRKNCNGELTPSLPCELAWGVDPNRNYGYGWGGPGSSSDVTSQSYHGPGPRSETEVQAVWNFVRSNHVTTLLTMHNVAALVLRPPGTSVAGFAPDEARLKAIGDAMGGAAGYTSQFGYELYDTSGTTEDDSYAATGGFGFTVEMGPPDGNFHMPYETGVVAEWTGQTRTRATAAGCARRC